ncbi:MAG: GIY-YIG nuclease family protein [Candidatus Curtissbacteria bacterium]|nr:GIY-YIG nuclease family protein [Candidatus Curtissbacteria bacterium]
MFYTYILKSKKDKKLYTGYTNNLRARLQKHQSQKVTSTKYREGLELIYFEGCLDETDAKKRERYLKSGPGKKFLKNRLKFYSERAEAR